jgi:hypothetical protein
VLRPSPLMAMSSVAGPSAQVHGGQVDIFSGAGAGAREHVVQHGACVGQRLCLETQHDAPLHLHSRVQSSQIRGVQSVTV